MKAFAASLALPLLLFAGSADAILPSQASSGLLPIPANRIVGLWTTTINVTPCQGGGPVITVHGASVFHAGGTLGETNTGSPTARGPGQGVWRYTGGFNYRTKFRFFIYLPDGSYNGMQEITTTTVLNPRATRYDANVRARINNPDGSLRVELCGSAVGERVNAY